MLLCRSRVVWTITFAVWPALVQAQRTAAAAVSRDASPLDTTVLATLRALVRESNPDLLARRSVLSAAEARLRAAGFASPSVLSAEVEDIPGGVNVAQAGSIRLALDHEFFGGARRFAARSAAAADVEWARADLRATEHRHAWVALQSLVRAIDWAAIARRLAAEDSLLASAQGSVETRFAVGGARYVDVLRLRTERLRTVAEQAMALSEARIARQQLLGMAAGSDSIGMASRAIVDSLIALRRDLPQVIVMLYPAPNVDSVLAASGAVRLADATLQQAQARRDLTLANQRPRLTAFAGVQRFSSDQGSHTIGPILGGSISLPFTARRANALAADAAGRDVGAATAERRASLASVRTELLAARDRYETARARLATYDAALLRGAREERETALGAYRNGSLSLIELLDFERALARAEIDRLRSEIEAATALSDLLTAGGTMTMGGTRRGSAPSAQSAP